MLYSIGTGLCNDSSVIKLQPLIGSKDKIGGATIRGTPIVDWLGQVVGGTPTSCFFDALPE